jgi:hypothetical protein
LFYFFEISNDFKKKSTFYRFCLKSFSKKALFRAGELRDFRRRRPDPPFDFDFDRLRRPDLFFEDRLDFLEDFLDDCCDFRRLDLFTDCRRDFRELFRAIFY